MSYIETLRHRAAMSRVGKKIPRFARNMHGTDV
jgi:hypothetical protein